MGTLPQKTSNTEIIGMGKETKNPQEMCASGVMEQWNEQLCVSPGGASKIKVAKGCVNRYKIINFTVRVACPTDINIG